MLLCIDTRCHSCITHCIITPTHPAGAQGTASEEQEATLGFGGRYNPDADAAAAAGAGDMQADEVLDDAGTQQQMQQDAAADASEAAGGWDWCI